LNTPNSKPQTLQQPTPEIRGTTAGTSGERGRTAGPGSARGTTGGGARSSMHSQVNTKPQTPNPRPQTPNPRPQTLDINHLRVEPALVGKPQIPNPQQTPQRPDRRLRLRRHAPPARAQDGESTAMVFERRSRGWRRRLAACPASSSSPGVALPQP